MPSVIIGFIGYIPKNVKIYIYIVTIQNLKNYERLV
nr:MAG TPA: hypothetical protein [Inoviridae sp.]